MPRWRNQAWLIVATRQTTDKPPAPPGCKKTSGAARRHLSSSIGIRTAQRRRVAFLRVFLAVPPAARVAFLRRFLRVAFFAVPPAARVAFLRVAFLRPPFLRVAFLRAFFLAFFATPGAARTGHYDHASAGPAAASAPGAMAPTKAGHYVTGAAGAAHDVNHETVVSGSSQTDGGHHGSHEHDPPLSMLVPLWILALLSITIGVYFTFVHGEPEFTSPGWLSYAAVGAAVAGITLAWLTYQRGAINAASLASAFGPIRQAALAKFWIDDFFERVLAAGTLAFSTLVGFVQW